jgi:hypothetical protein
MINAKSLPIDPTPLDSLVLCYGTHRADISLERVDSLRKVWVDRVLKNGMEGYKGGTWGKCRIMYVISSIEVYWTFLETSKSGFYRS